MPVMRKECTCGFTHINNEALNSDLGPVAGWVLVKMLSLPDGWRFSEKGLSSIIPHCGSRRIHTALKELEDNGFLKRERIFENGKIKEWRWTFADYKLFEPTSSNPGFNATSPQSTNSENHNVQNEELHSEDLHDEGLHQSALLNKKELNKKDRENKGCARKTETKGKSGKAGKEEKKAHGEFGNVLLTGAELARLQERFPNDWNDRIANLSEYMASTGKAYKSHYATILTWARKDRERRQGAAASGSAPKKSGKTNAATKPQPSPSPAAESGDAAAYAELSEEEWLAGIADRHVSSAELKGRCPWLDEEEVVRLCRYFAMPWRELRQEGVEELESRIKAHNASLADK